MVAPVPSIRAKLTALNRSAFRAKFKLSPKDLDYISGRGLETIGAHAFDFVTARIAPAHPKNDGRQTPWRGHPVFTAQHATATCCRRCIAKWHGIEKGRPLTDGEVHFIVALIMGWIEKDVHRPAASGPRMRSSLAAGRKSPGGNPP